VSDAKRIAEAVAAAQRIVFLIFIFFSFC